jgi:type IV secretory pathway TraG/TraD family ATPase VirD4
VSSTSRRSVGPVSGLESWLLLFVLVPLAAFLVIAYGAFELTGNLAGERVPVSPIELGGNLIRGKLAVPEFFWVIAIGALFALFTAVVWVGIMAAKAAQDPPDTWVGRWVISSSWMLPDRHIFRAARWMGQGRQIRPLLEHAARNKARRFGIEGAPGRLLGSSVLSGQMLYADYEAVGIDISGPRHYKTTARATPAIVTAPGAVMGTSNKPDLLHQTRGVRERGGAGYATGEVFVFDPDRVAHEPNSMWWDPLSYINSEREALQLADIWSAATREEGAKSDAFFEPAGTQLVADLLLAAAVAPRDTGGQRRYYVNQIYRWLSDKDNDEAAGLLKAAGFNEFAADLHAKYHAADDEKSGVFSTALGICAFMLNGPQMRWVLPPQKWRVPPTAGQAVPREFHPEAFVRSGRPPVTKRVGHLFWARTVIVEKARGDTLYSMSREGKANAGPIVAALTIAVTEAAESYAKSCGGRLPVPLTVQLDEVANVCRVRQLPDWWSFWGSHGIVATAYLQSFSQGVSVWGKEGMNKLWSASNVKIYGGNVGEEDFLDMVSKIVGRFDQYSRSLTTGHGDTVQRSTHREVILDIDDLAGMEAGVLVVMAGGCRPVLARAIGFWQLDEQLHHGVEASLDKYDPQRIAKRQHAAASDPLTGPNVPQRALMSDPAVAVSPLSGALRRELQTASTRLAQQRPSTGPAQTFAAAQQFALEEDEVAPAAQPRDPYEVLAERFGPTTRRSSK